MSPTREKKKPYHVVIDGDGRGMVITGGGREKPRGGWLARGSWLTLFPSARQARAAISRTRQFAKDNAMPWLKDIRHYHIVAVTLSRANERTEHCGAQSSLAPVQGSAARKNFMTPEQCAKQFEMYAESNPRADSQHSLRFCAEFLREFCIQPNDQDHARSKR